MFGIGKYISKKTLGASVCADPPVADCSTGDCSEVKFHGVRGSSLLGYSFSGGDDALKAYSTCPPLYSLIARKVQSILTGNMDVVISSGKGKGSTSTSSDANAIRKLLNNPNPLQTYDDFISQAYIYTQLYDYCIILPIKRTGFSSVVDARSLWVLPPSRLTIRYKKNIDLLNIDSSPIDTISFNVNGKNTYLNVEDVVIMRNTSNLVTMDSYLTIPQSRLKSIEAVINNLVASYDAQYKLLAKRGAMGILTNDAMDANGVYPLRSTDIEQLQKDFNSYGLGSDQFSFIMTNANLKWQAMGIPTKDLLLFEGMEEMHMRLCDAYSYPYLLMSNKVGAGLGGNQIEQSMKQLYQDAILPESSTIAKQLNKMFGLDEKNIKIQIDYSHVSCLQLDKVQMFTANKLQSEIMVGILASAISDEAKRFSLIKYLDIDELTAETILKNDNNN